MSSPLANVCRLLLLGLVISLVACDNNAGSDQNRPEANPGTPQVDAPQSQTAASVDDRWQAHLAAMPSGLISARSAIVVRFSHPVFGQQQVGKPVSGVARLASQKPVTVVATSPDTLSVQPQEPFASGESVTLLLFA